MTTPIMQKFSKRERIYARIYIFHNNAKAKNINNFDSIKHIINVLDDDISTALQTAGVKDEKNYRIVLDKKEEEAYYVLDTAKTYTIFEKDIQTKKVKRSVATCAYSATERYLQTNFGVSLHSTDREWYCDNSLVTIHGLPQENTLTVIQQLIEPYNFGISRVQVPRNSRRFPKFTPFIEGLGANPFFMADGNTTNEEAYDILYPEQRLINEKINTPEKRAAHKQKILAEWRFEATDTPVSNSIGMHQFVHDQTGHNGASSYIAPRQKFQQDNWKFSILLDRLSNIKYLKPIVLPDYTMADPDIDYDYFSIKNAEGEEIRKYKPQRKWESPYPKSSYNFYNRDYSYLENNNHKKDGDNWLDDIYQQRINNPNSEAFDWSSNFLD